MKWLCSSFQVAAAQISSVREPCKTIEEVHLIISHDVSKYEQEKDYLTIIDKALAGNNFPSLRLVILRNGARLDYFPILQSRNLLEVME